MDQRIKDAYRETVERMLARMTIEERLKGVSAEELARAIPPEVLALAQKLAANGSAAKPQN